MSHFVRNVSPVFPEHFSITFGLCGLWACVCFFLSLQSSDLKMCCLRTQPATGETASEDDEEESFQEVLKSSRFALPVTMSPAAVQAPRIIAFMHRSRCPGEGYVVAGPGAHVATSAVTAGVTGVARALRSLSK